MQASFTLDSMCRRHMPKGLILNINRQPLTVLPKETIRQDHDYWSRYTARLIGSWLTEKTSIGEVCDFAGRVHLRGELTSFSGEPKFLSPNRVPNANEDFADLRSAIAGVYAWRAANGRSSEEKS